MSDPTDAVAKLEDLLTALRACADPRRAKAEWTQAYRLLQGTDLVADQVTAVVGMRDVKGLAALIEELRVPEADRPDDATCEAALAAFRKRLELAALDEASKLGHSPLTKGRDARGIAAIAPPRQWPEAVWKELARRGSLRHVGHGLYELVNP